MAKLLQRNSQSHVLVKPLQLRLFQSRMCQAHNRQGQTLRAVACHQLHQQQHHRRTTTGSSPKARRGQYPAAEYCGVIRRLCAVCRAQCTSPCSQCSEQLELLRYATFLDGTVQIAANQCLQIFIAQTAGRHSLNALTFQKRRELVGRNSKRQL